MAKVLDPKTPVRIVPAGQDGKPESRRIAYLVKPPTHLDHVVLQRALAQAGARHHPPVALLEAMAADAEEMKAAGGAAETFDAIVEACAARVEAVRGYAADYQAGKFDLHSDEGKAEMLAAVEAAFGAGAEVLDRAESALADLPGSRYRALSADNAVYFYLAGYEFARRLLVGWEGLGSFPKGANGVRDSDLEKIPYEHLALIGAEVDALFRPSEPEAKN